MNQRILLIIIGIIILAVVGYVLMVSPSQEQEQGEVPVPTKVSVALDWFPWAAQAGLWAAKEKGYFADEGLDITLNVPSDPSTVLQTVGSGRNDFGVSYLPDILLARAQDVPVVSVMALVQHPLYALITPQESNVDEPKDLVGKKIGHSGLAFNEIIIDTMLKSQGKSLGEVEPVNVGFDILPALLGKQVDAIVGYWTYESIAAENQSFPVNILRAEQHGVPDYYELALVTNEEKIAKNPDLVQRFVHAAKRGYEDAIADPQGAVQLMKRLNPEIDLNVDSKGINLLVPVFKSKNGVFGWQEESTWVAFTKWTKDSGFLSKDVDARQAFTNRFVENAR